MGQLELPFVPFGSQVEEVAALRERFPLPEDGPCMYDCSDCSRAGFCLDAASKDTPDA